MLGKERVGKVYQIRDRHVIRIGPPGGKLVAVARLFSFLHRAFRFLFNVGKPGGIAVIFCERAVRYDKELYIFKQSRVSPERLPVVAVNLVKSLLQLDAPSFQLNMHHGQTVHQNCHIISVAMRTIFSFILVDDLQAVVVDIGLVDQVDIFHRPIVTCQQLNVILLNDISLLLYTQVLIRNLIPEEEIPLVVAEIIIIQSLQLNTQIDNQIPFTLYRQIIIRLLLQLFNQHLFQISLRLVSRCPFVGRLILSNNR